MSILDKVLVGVLVVVVVFFTFFFVSALDFEILDLTPPYGAWLDVSSGEQKFYSSGGEFYENTQAILDLQEELYYSELPAVEDVVIP